MPNDTSRRRTIVSWFGAAAIAASRCPSRPPMLLALTDEVIE